MTKIFFKPRTALRELIAIDNIFLPAILVGTAGYLRTLLDMAAKDGFSQQSIDRLISVPLVVVGLWLLASLAVHLLSLCLGGGAPLRKTMIALGFACSPWLLALTFTPMMVLGSLGFGFDSTRQAAGHILSAIRGGLDLWAICMAIVGIKETHRFQTHWPWLSAVMAVVGAPLLLISTLIFFMLAIILLTIIYGY